MTRSTLFRFQIRVALVPLLTLAPLACEQERVDEATAAPPSAASDELIEAEQLELTQGPPADTLILPETNYYEIQTSLGRMVVRLYDETPGHRDNFKRLVESQAFDSTQFHRVITGFMVQGGDPNSIDDDPTDDGMGGPGYTLPAEFNARLIHKRGALAAARQGDPVNPEKRSSGSQFYIVQGGTPVPDSVLSMIEQNLGQKQPGFTFSDSVRAIYTTTGGAPHLDTQYTIFGELVEGFDVLDAIASAPTPHSQRQRVPQSLGDHPLTPIRMTIRPLPSYSAPAPAD